MDAAKDLLKRAVELDSAQRYSEAIICYEEGIQNILRAIGGIPSCGSESCTHAVTEYSGVSSLLIIHGTGIKDESGKKDLRKKAEEYLNRAEQIKEMIKSQDGVGNKMIQHT